MNLTKATLGAYLKYPNTKKIDKNKISRKKRGVFQSEKEYLDIIIKDTGMIYGKSVIRHPLSFLVEAADNICYRAMDIEDGFNKKWFSFDELVSHFQGSEIYTDLVKIKNEKKKLCFKDNSF